MKTISTGALSGERVAKRIVFLAYSASLPMGLGWLHERSGVPEEETSACVSGGFIDADYVHGRMVKLRGLAFGPNSVTFNDELEPRCDYQSWCGTYPTYEALVKAAIESFEDVKA